MINISINVDVQRLKSRGGYRHFNILLISAHLRLAATECRVQSGCFDIGVYVCGTKSDETINTFMAFSLRSSH